jgi:hypothetical protein
LIEGPEEVRVYAPEWSPLFLEVAERTPEEWLQSAGEWLATLAVVRAERGESAAFREVFAAVLRRLQALSDREPMRWHELLQFVLAWGLRRRPGEETDPLLQAARRSHRSARQKAVIGQMADVILKSRDQEMLEQGELREARRTLRMLLEDRFAPLPDSLVAQIEQVEDIARLRGAIRQTSRLDDLSNLRL